VHNDLAAAQGLLRTARDAEVEAAETLRVARAAAMLDPDCPKPKRGENGVTVADRDSWIDTQVRQQRRAADGAEAYRKSAEDHLRVVRDQASVVQSMSALMRAEMALTGTPGTP
jgi:hypothetical protein